MQNHSSKHCCAYCKAFKNNIGEWVTGALRTIQDLENDNNAWQELTGGDRSKLKNYFNVEFHPLLEDKNSLVLFLLPPPPLHLLLLGQGNKLWETLEKICIQRFGKNIQNNPLMKFAKKINVVKAPFHGKTFNGNEINKIFKKIHILEKHMGLPEDLMPIVSCIKDLRSLVKGVGGKKLNSNYSKLIDNYVASYSNLHQVFGVSKTPKFHVIEEHLKYYIDTTKKSLGFYSDSLIESMHQYLDKLMCKSNYHVKDVESEIHGVKLLKAIKHLNTYNLE